VKFVPNEFVTPLPPSCNSNYFGYKLFYPRNAARYVMVPRQRVGKINRDKNSTFSATQKPPQPFPRPDSPQPFSLFPDGTLPIKKQSRIKF
ncbi:hypothetical protein, partial [Dickeya dianthicola]